MRQLIYILIFCLGTISSLVEAKTDNHWSLEQRTPFNEKIQTTEKIHYNALTSAKKKLAHLCISSPP